LTYAAAVDCDLVTTLSVLTDIVVGSAYTRVLGRDELTRTFREIAGDIAGKMFGHSIENLLRDAYPRDSTDGSGDSPDRSSERAP
jgi:hypothetical protein